MQRTAMHTYQVHDAWNVVSLAIIVVAYACQALKAHACACVQVDLREATPADQPECRGHLCSSQRPEGGGPSLQAGHALSISTHPQGGLGLLRHGHRHKATAGRVRPHTECHACLRQHLQRCCAASQHGTGMLVSPHPYCGPGAATPHPSNGCTYHQPMVRSTEKIADIARNASTCF